MLSPFRVARLVASEEFDRLLNEVLMNAPPVPLAVRVRLSEQGALTASALGLALKRLTELTWRPEPPATELARRLFDLQHPDGSFGPVVSTICSASGLSALLAQSAALPGISGTHHTDFLPEGLLERAAQAVESARTWLVQQPTLAQALVSCPHTNGAGVAVRRSAPNTSELIDTAVLLWQFAQQPEALHSLGITQPAHIVDRLGLRHHRESAPLVESVFTPDRSLSRRAA